MKWLYITFGILGGLVPTAYLYARTYAGAENKVRAFDLGLIFLGLGLSFMVMPIGIGVGLLVAALVHLGWSQLQRCRTLSAARPGQANNQQEARQSWVARRLEEQNALKSASREEDASRHGS